MRTEAHRLQDEDYSLVGKQAIDSLFEADVWMTEWIDNEKEKGDVSA